MLGESIHNPVNLVKPVADATSFLRWRMEPVAPARDTGQKLMQAGDVVTLDFSDHLTGHLTFSIVGVGKGVDAPTRLKLTFGEVPVEVVEPFDPHTGILSRAWLQDETINLDILPSTITLPRRYAFRYLKIEVIATSANFGVRIDGVKATAFTSAQTTPPELPGHVSHLLRRIDAVSIHTLRECMQTVFEDGPKRDRRCWIGDLRLQALVNYVTFRDFDLVKHCLYLFAGLPREDGLVSALVAEHPQPLRGHEFILDYAALYGATVLDYAKASGDWETARDLWPVVRRQMEILARNIGSDGLFDPTGGWIFIDWSESLDPAASMHGVYLFALHQILALPNTWVTRKK